MHAVQRTGSFAPRLDGAALPPGGMSAQISLLVLAPNITCVASLLPGAHY